MKNRFQRAQRCSLAVFVLVALAATSASAQVKQIKLRAGVNEASVVSVAALQKIAPDFDGKNFYLMTSDTETPDADAKGSLSRPVPAQADDIDGDGKTDEIAFTIAPPARGNARTPRIVTLNYGTEAAIAPLRTVFPSRAHALYAKKYEGMGWESDKIAWRIYFDRRNAIDIYGKKKHGLALDYFAKPGVNYHAESPIGRDIFKNGETLGVGSIGAVVDGKVVRVSDVEKREWRVVADGPVRAIAELKYTGWKVGGKSVDLTSRLTIWAGQHGFEHHVTARNAEGITLVTGLPKKPQVQVMLSKAEGPLSSRSAPGKAYLATWGKQVLEPGATSVAALPNENMGLGIVVPVASGAAPVGPENAGDTLLTVTLDKNSTARYYVVAAWDQEAADTSSPFGVGVAPELALPAAVRTAEAWERYVASLRLTPPVVEIVSKKAQFAPQANLGGKR